jgi:hypothetical protein
LLDADDNVIATTVSDDTGGYLFPITEPGDYKIRQIVPAGFEAVADADGGDFTIIGEPTPITVALDDFITGQDFVNLQYRSIGERSSSIPTTTVSATPRMWGSR